MSDAWERLRREARAVTAAPVVFGFVVLLAGVLMWGVVQWSYRGVIAARDRQIEFLERRLPDWRDKLWGMSPDEARARVQALETQVRGLQNRLQPRHLTNEQQQAIEDRARLRGGLHYAVTVRTQIGCGDCEAFGAAIAAALRATTSWTIALDTVPAASERVRYGLAIRVVDPLRPPPEAARLQDALQSAGLAFETSGGAPEGSVELIVTERPL
ncbi:MAG: hypothetical protein J0H62_05525 [Rhizobiales bacterium]|nr:hypothetical protein [Hyphomicrobiales bacterium]